MANKPALGPEFRAIIDQFAKFRNRYSILKNHYTAQEELIQFQKLELEKANSYVDRLGTALIDSRKSYNIKLNSLEMKIKQLQRDVVNSREEFKNLVENRRRNDDDDDDDHVRNLEDALTAIRTQVNLENARHREEIESMIKRHNEEVNLYRKKLEEATKIAPKTCLTTKNRASYVHPAFEDEPKKRKKTTSLAAFKWPQVDFPVNKDMTATHVKQSELLRNKKKLYHIDNETIVDLTL